MGRISQVLALAAGMVMTAAVALADPLPSWNDTETKAAILAFVDSVTNPDSDKFVPEPARIAVFDNDGTLWSEQPVYFQAIYALERVREQAKADPSILKSNALKAAAEGDLKGIMAGGKEGLVEILNVSHSGMSVDEFKAGAYEWLTTAKHPTSGLVFADMTFQPMVELLRYLRDENFKTYIVSGGGVDFIRAIAKQAYNIPPSQVIGSEGALRYEVKDGVPTLMKDGGISFIDDKAGKPVGINRFIGQRPIFAGGNSDGDFEMLEWVTAGDGPSFGLLVHHTDSEREFAYDRESHIGTLAKGLDEAKERGWVLVDMAEDWSRVWTGKP
jgi:phosphoglycolate phosphatase-like HAD superfamily hydrolase